MKLKTSMSSMPSVLLGVVVGAVTAANAKGIAKTAAKGFMAVEEMTSSWTAGMREGMRDAVEEARFEREAAAAWREQQRRQMYGQERPQTDESGTGDQPSTDSQKRDA